MNVSTTSVEAPVRQLLEQLDAGAGSPVRSSAEENGQDRAGALLAHIAWARLAEPGDALASAMIEALGPTQALAEVIQGRGSSPRRDLAQRIGASPAQLREAQRRWEPRLNRPETLRDIERAVAGGLRVLLPGDRNWPMGFDDLGVHRPLMLWFKGEVTALCAPSLSVVGARAVTGYGTHVTAEIVNDVCGAGVAVVSGAAYGVDAVAHRTALAAETPTVAVLAGGADRAYPQAHETLLERIAHSGVVCSEMIPGAAPTRWRFLQRNRLIAALSAATLVTEAGARSGSINTAGHAASLGRALGAVPGPITSAASTGCHRLLREYGAALVTSGAEALELLGIGALGIPVNGPEIAAGDSTSRQPSIHQRVLDSLPLRGNRNQTELAGKAGLGLAEIGPVLAELELLGYVRKRDSPHSGEAEWRLLRRK